MLSVSSIKITKHNLVIFVLLTYFSSSAQENSPFSRYGLGDVFPSQNIVNRAMGGITSTYATGNSVNFSNPASYSAFKLNVTYDIGLTIDTRTLRSAIPVAKYNTANFSPSYVALGIPLSKTKNFGLAIGLRPISKVNYSIEETKRLPADSMLYLYNGDGGLYQTFVGIGKKWGGFSAGVNTGFLFGRKENKTSAIPIDSVLTYKSNSTTLTTFNSAFINVGLQYEVPVNKTTFIHFGASGNLGQNLKAIQQVTRETFVYDFNGNPVVVDSVYKSPEEEGKIKLPTSYIVGVGISKMAESKGYKYEKASVNIEYESTQWTSYRFYEQQDKLKNSWQMRIGGQLVPNPISTNYWNWVAYRTGFSYGQEAFFADGKGMNSYTFTLGAGLPVRKHRSYDYQSTVINTTFEMGKRGSAKNNVTENFFRISLGFNLSDIWFNKRKYE